MRTYAFETWDVFTDRRFAGNPLAIVMDAQGLSGEEMQAIAREFNLSETSFVLAPEEPGHTARVRIFTPGYEMPFAGHPTVGTAIAVAEARGIEGEVLFELNAGLFPVRVERKGDAISAEFRNPNAPAEHGAAPSAAQIEAALSLPSGSVDRDEHRPRRVGAGVDYIYARAPLSVVQKAKLDSAAWEKLSLDEIVGVLLYAEGGETAVADYHVRMFAPGAGVAEDPATGSAASALPGQVALSERLADDAYSWRVEQGFEMGRPSIIRVSFDVVNGAASTVRVGGGAVKMSSGEIYV